MSLDDIPELLKRGGKATQAEIDQLTKDATAAKIQEFNHAITEGTIDRPDSLTGLQSMIDAGSAGLVSFCDSTSNEPFHVHFWECTAAEYLDFLKNPRRTLGGVTGWKFGVTGVATGWRLQPV